MGAGANKSPAVGVPLNPRVDHAEGRTRQEGREIVIDAPVLVELHHGTVRYRYKADDQAEGDPTTAQQKKARVERPHEGPERDNKHGYFFHTRPGQNNNKVNSDNTADENDNSWQMAYVYKGSDSSRQKKLFYVFGKGLQSPGVESTSPEKPQIQAGSYQEQSASGSFKLPGHVYFELSFLEPDGDVEEDEDDLTDMDTFDELSGQPSQPMGMGIRVGDKAGRLCQRLAIRLVKPRGHVHVYWQGREMAQDQLVAALHTNRSPNWKRLKIQLSPI